MYETIWPGLASLGILSTLLIPLFILILCIMLICLPFWVLRIRNELIELNKKIAYSPEPQLQGKICPECAESVLLSALVCKHCHHRFDETRDKRAEEADKQCRFCGAYNKAGDQHCGRCGHQLHSTNL